MRDAWEKLDTRAKVLPVVALLGFFLSLSLDNRSSANGVVTQCSHIDLAALTFAAICVVGGLSLVRSGLWPDNLRRRQVRTWHLAIGVVVAVVGLVHALRGIGIIGGPCG